MGGGDKVQSFWQRDRSAYEITALALGTVALLAIFKMFWFDGWALGSWTFLNGNKFWSNFALLAFFPAAIAVQFHRIHPKAGLLLFVWTAFLLSMLTSIVCIWGLWFVGALVWIELGVAVFLILLLGPFKLWSGLGAMRKGGGSTILSDRILVALLFICPQIFFGWMHFKDWSSESLLFPKTERVSMGAPTSLNPRTLMPFAYQIELPDGTQPLNVLPNDGELCFQKDRFFVVLSSKNALAVGLKDLHLGPDALKAFMDERFGAVPSMLKTLAVDRPERFLCLEGNGIIAYAAIDPVKKNQTRILKIEIWDERGQGIGNILAQWPVENGPPETWLKTLQLTSVPEPSANQRLAWVSSAYGMGDSRTAGIQLAYAALQMPPQPYILRRYALYQENSGREAVAKKILETVNKL
jgi:hypothetical protein